MNTMAIDDVLCNAVNDVADYLRTDATYAHGCDADVALATWIMASVGKHLERVGLPIKQSKKAREKESKHFHDEIVAAFAEWARIEPHVLKDLIVSYFTAQAVGVRLSKIIAEREGGALGETLIDTTE